MKKYFFSLLTVCLFAFSSCSNEDGLTPSINEVEKDINNIQQRSLDSDEEDPQLQRTERTYQSLDIDKDKNKKDKIGIQDEYTGDGDEEDPG